MSFFPHECLCRTKADCAWWKSTYIQNLKKPWMAQHLKLQPKRFQEMQWGPWKTWQCSHPFIVPNLVSKGSFLPRECRPNLHNNQSHTALNHSCKLSVHLQLQNTIIGSSQSACSHEPPPFLSSELWRKSWIGRLTLPIFKDKPTQGGLAACPKWDQQRQIWEQR